MPPDIAYRRLNSIVFYKASIFAASRFYLGQNFRPFGSTFGRRPLTGWGGGFDLNGQMPLKNRKSKVDGR